MFVCYNKKYSTGMWLRHCRPHVPKPLQEGFGTERSTDHWYERMAFTVKHSKMCYWTQALPRSGKSSTNSEKGKKLVDQIRDSSYWFLSGRLFFPKKLIIEVDGLIHNFRKIKHPMQKNSWAQQKGFGDTLYKLTKYYDADNILNDIRFSKRKIQAVGYKFIRGPETGGTLYLCIFICPK
jgi:hypothetical protein